jgi:hypothetical protein
VIYEIEGIHPLEGGILRLKYRCDRRPGLAIEWPGLFHLRLAAENARKACRYLKYVRRAREIGRKVRADPTRLAYVDTAITPTVDDEIENLMLYTQTAGGEAAVQRKRAEDRLRSIFGSARTPKMV